LNEDLNKEKLSKYTSNHINRGNHQRKHRKEKEHSKGHHKSKKAHRESDRHEKQSQPAHVRNIVNFNLVL
jgi:hypothetical protein